MFKKILLITGMTIITGGLLWGAINRTQAKTNSEGQGRGGYRHPEAVENQPDYYSGGNRYGAQNRQAGLESVENHLQPAHISGEYTLTDSETAALLYMVEEEKLAGDLYLRFYELWGLPVFQNIQQSEMQHQQSVANLLERYGIENPSSAEAGVFVNPDLQALYQELVTTGSKSLLEALRVGALVEELDISDLQQRLAQTTNPEVKQVFNNLMNGSIRHLNTFAAQYTRQSAAAYQPQVLSADQMAQILGTTGNGQTGNPNGSSWGYRGGRD